MISNRVSEHGGGFALSANGYITIQHNTRQYNVIQYDLTLLASVTVLANSLRFSVSAGSAPQRNFSVTNHSLHVNTYEIHAELLQHVVHELLDAAFIDSCRSMA